MTRNTHDDQNDHFNLRPAADVPYDNSGSGLTATDVQAALDELAAAAVVLTLTNVSGASVAAGDVVVLATTANDSFTTSTGGADTRPVGIVQETIANGAAGHVQFGGFAAFVNVTASVTRGDYLETSTTAKKATQNATRHAGSFGFITVGGTSPSAYLFAVPDLGTGGGGGSTITVQETGGSPSTGSVSTVQVANYTNLGGGVVVLLPGIVGTGAGVISFDTGSDTLVLYSADGWNAGTGSWIELTDDSLFLIDIKGASTLSGKGVIFNVGDDSLSLIVGEKDATTIQIYDGNSGAYDILFEEQSDSHHFQFKALAGGIAEPAMGMFPKYSAAPHAGVEVEGEGYYDTTLHKARIWNGSSWNNLW